MNRFIGISTWFLVVLTAACLALAGAAGAASMAAETFPCVTDNNLDKTIAPEASLEDFSCMFKRWEGSETLHFKVAIKNISSTDQRFKVNIFLDNDKAVGGLIPPSTKKGLLKPGEVAAFTYPVKGMNQKPHKVILIIKTMEN